MQVGISYNMSYGAADPIAPVDSIESSYACLVFPQRLLFFCRRGIARTLWLGIHLPPPLMQLLLCSSR